MRTTIELLDAAKAASGCESDYAIGQRLGISRQVISSWRQGKATFNDDHAALIAGILGREPGEVMALCQAERAKSETARSRWLRVAALLAAIVAPPAAGGVSPAPTLDNNASGMPITSIKQGAAEARQTHRRAQKTYSTAPSRLRNSTISPRPSLRASAMALVPS